MMFPMCFLCAGWSLVRRLFFTVDGIDANQTQGNNCGVTKNPKEPPPDGERPAVFLFHGGRSLSLIDASQIQDNISWA